MRFKIDFILPILFLFIQKSSKCQDWIFEITPGMKFFSSNYIKTKGERLNTNINSYEFKKLEKIKSFMLEPEIFINFYRINPKWQLGVGFTTFKMKNMINVSAKGNSILLDSTNLLFYNEIISKEVELLYAQFTGTISRTFRTKTILDNFILNRLILGIGINRSSMFNPRYTERMYFSSLLDNNLGYETVLEYKRNKAFGNCSPFLQLKYELVIMKKKNDFGRLNINFSYVQGFQNQYKYIIESKNTDGANLRVESIFRLSGFRFGISKTFSFTKLDKNKNLFGK